MLKIVFSLMLLLFFNYSPSVEAANFVCGQDLNGNGYLGEQGEYTSCKEATINNSVPAGQSCLAGFTMMPNGTCMKYEYSPQNPQCPQGSFVQNGRCLTITQIQPTAYCPTNYVLSGNYCVRVTWTQQSNSCPLVALFRMAAA